MDIHQLFQSIGQILYLLIQAFSEWIQSLTVFIGSFLQEIKFPSVPTAIKLFSNISINRIVFLTVAGYIIFINIITSALFNRDKKNSRLRKQRIAEKTLIKVCVLGGACGGFLGMYVCHHKTLHKKFNTIVPVLFIVQLILYSFILGFLGFWAFL